MPRSRRAIAPLTLKSASTSPASAALRYQLRRQMRREFETNFVFVHVSTEGIKFNADLQRCVGMVCGCYTAKGLDARIYEHSSTCFIHKHRLVKCHRNLDPFKYDKSSYHGFLAGDAAAIHRSIRSRRNAKKKADKESSSSSSEESDYDSDSEVELPEASVDAANAKSGNNSDYSETSDEEDVGVVDEEEAAAFAEEEAEFDKEEEDEEDGKHSDEDSDEDSDISSESDVGSVEY